MLVDPAVAVGTGQGPRAPRPHTGAASPPSPLSPRRRAAASTALYCALLVLGFGCAGAAPHVPEVHEAITVQAVSALGRPLVPAVLAPAEERRLRRDLFASQLRYQRAPDTVEAALGLGRCWANLGEYREAIATYTRALTDHPDDPRLLRDRGHRYLTTRQLEPALVDLLRARAMLERTPSAAEQGRTARAVGGRSTPLRFDVEFHLGLVQYLLGDFEEAERTYRSCLERSDTVAARCVASYWLALTRLQLEPKNWAGSVPAGAVAAPPTISDDPHCRTLAVLDGSVSPTEALSQARSAPPGQFATIAYGVAMHCLFGGDTESSTALLEEVLREGNWTTFVAIASEIALRESQRSRDAARVRREGSHEG
ncbi:MAG: tetratricopeptide repeat protein [Planctomycetota bacterium]